MKRFLTFAGLLLLFTPTAFAQKDDFYKWEFYGGYSAMRFDNLGGDTGNANFDDVLGGKNTLRGFNLQITRNFRKLLGAKFDFSDHFRTDDFTRPAGSGNVDTNLQNYLGGIQVKNNAKEGPRFRPFAHLLFGIAHQRETINSAQLRALFGVDSFLVSFTSFSMVAGGGVDIRLNDHLDVRAGQVDLNVIARGEQKTGVVLVATPAQTVGQPFVIPSATQENLRLGAGIVVHWK